MKLKTLAIAAAFAVAPFTMQAAELPDGPHIATSGSSIVKAKPDMATLFIEVNVSNKSAAEAKKKSDERVAKYIDFLQKNGIDKADIDAANIQTRIEYSDGSYVSSAKRTIKGYIATRQVKVTVRQLDKLNALLDGALANELNEINDVQLGVMKDETYRDEARQQAVKDAVEKANALAKEFGVKLGPVFSIRYNSSGGGAVPAASYRSKAMSYSSSAADESYQQQSIDFNDRVEVVFDIQREPKAN
ncbi:26 kDa periplasmic immunogenic protein precursor [Leminorella richardii]|uniref:26 kDa periplasmic immunogenic protein n=1 Tax=Leminorella richardii TaxID=158841 RepID=A0A2X4U9R9_9GAMM|nr:oxidative stress defense protein [Leminorella richardii]SQI35923.1 26 kDa periplasmic immunogenic protein precursor [Leminorella richardii]